LGRYRDPDEERIVLNESSVWSGSAGDVLIPECHEKMKNIIAFVTAMLLVPFASLADDATKAASMPNVVFIFDEWVTSLPAHPSKTVFSRERTPQP
jgi:hypothetical protein